MSDGIQFGRLANAVLRVPVPCDALITRATLRKRSAPKSVHMRFVGTLEEWTFLRQFFSMPDVKKCRVNTGEKLGGPGRDRTDDLFHAMEARSQLRHRPIRMGVLINSYARALVSQTSLPCGRIF
jgi:hypothetical protein